MKQFLLALFAMVTVCSSPCFAGEPFQALRADDLVDSIGVVQIVGPRVDSRRPCLGKLDANKIDDVFTTIKSLMATPKKRSKAKAITCGHDDE